MIKRIINNRRIIFLTLIYIIKYTSYKWLYSDKKFIKLVLLNIEQQKELNSENLQLKRLIMCQIEKVIQFFNPHATCLIRSLVKQDVLLKYGYYIPIYLGIQNANDILFAHAWLENDNNKDYTKVFQI